MSALSDAKAVVPITNLGPKKQRASNEEPVDHFSLPNGLFAVS